MEPLLFHGLRCQRFGNCAARHAGCHLRFRDKSNARLDWREKQAMIIPWSAMGCWGSAWWTRIVAVFSATSRCRGGHLARVGRLAGVKPHS